MKLNLARVRRWVFADCWKCLSVGGNCPWKRPYLPPRYLSKSRVTPKVIKLYYPGPCPTEIEVLMMLNKRGCTTKCYTTRYYVKILSPFIATKKNIQFRYSWQFIFLPSFINSFINFHKTSTSIYFLLDASGLGHYGVK